MSTQSQTQSTGVSAIGLLGIIFVLLKLFGITAVAEWSWWWVLAPFWGGMAFVVALLLIFGLIAAVMFILDR